MELKLNYKQTEAGVIPKDWEWATLLSVAKEAMQNGLFFNPLLKGIGVKLINVGDLYRRTPIDSEALALFGATSKERERFGVENGDLFFTRSSIVPSGIAYCNIYRSRDSEAVVFDSHVIRLRPNTLRVIPEYLFRYCVSSPARRYLVSCAKTATMTTIDQGLLGKCPIALPPLSEQKVIAEALSDVDALIESLDTLVAKKRQLKQAAMQVLLTGNTRLLGFSGEWRTVELGSLVREHNSGVYKSARLYGKGSNIIGVSDLYDIAAVKGQVFGLVPLNDQEHKKHTLNKDDLLYSESSLVREGIARTVYVAQEGAGTAFAWHTRRYRVDQDALRSDFLCHYLGSRTARKHMIDNCIQTAITGINTSSYFACPVPLPSLAEQTAIAAALTEMDVEMSILETKTAKTRELKRGMMQELLTGRTRLV